jgi:Tol biopolymer transport system component
MRQLRMMTMVVALALVSSACVFLARVSVDVNGAAFAGDIDVEAVSGDGRYVVMSTPEPLLASDTNIFRDLYRKDTVTGALELVSASIGGSAVGSFADASISDDGRLVAFSSLSTNVVSGDTDGVADAFVRDMVDQTSTLVSVDDNGAQVNAGAFDPLISGDGSVVAWRSDGAFVGGASNGLQQIYRRGFPTGTTALVSASSAGVMGDDGSFQASIDADGSVIAFTSGSTNLVTGDTNGVDDVFARFAVGLTVRVSVAQGGAEANGHSTYPAVAGNGLSIAFDSLASNLAPSDTNGRRDVFVKALSGAVERASVTSGGGQVTGGSYFPSISADGSVVAFMTDAMELNGGFGFATAQVRELDQGTTVLASVSDSGGLVHTGLLPNAFVSADGNYVAFSADESTGPVVPGDNNGTRDVFVRWWSEPEILSVNPATLTLGAIQPVTITGTGFRGGGAVTDLYTNRLGTDGITFSNIVVVDDTTITADVETVVGVTPSGPKVLWLENPGTGPGPTGGALVNCACLSVSP